LKIVIVGAGPAGLEAGRVASARGHEVVMFEAANEPGGQIRLATRVQRRKELIGIADWRAERCVDAGVDMRFNVYAEAGDVRALDPDVVIIATGGLPQSPELEEGEDLLVSSWDILSGDVKPADDVLLYENNGQHPGFTAAEFICRSGSKLEVITPERFVAPDVGGMNFVPYAQAFQETGTQITINTDVSAVCRKGDKLEVALSSKYTGGPVGERLVDQVVAEYGTAPLDELYFELKEESCNRGEVDYQALINGRAQEIATNPDGKFQLFRIGDAVASRNIHAAIYDGLRFMKDI
ncbi:MAG: FAD-dependent oxidoreductase, partial [Rhizobiales bacterium]|nr:FAD-dependent oxidoreductase [Hyphomicrobiales bacterium]